MNPSRSAITDSSLLGWLLTCERRVVPNLGELLALEDESRKVPPSDASLRSFTQSQMTDLGDLVPDSKEDPGKLTTGRQAGDFVAIQQAGLDQESVLLLVDQRITMRFGNSGKTKSIVAARTAAFIAWQALAQEKSIGAIIFNDRTWAQLRPQSSRRRVRLILHALQQDPKLGPFGSIRSNLGMLNEVLRHDEFFPTGNCLVVLITDSSGCDDDTFCLVKSLSCKNRFLVALIYDPNQGCFKGGDWFFSEVALRKTRAKSQDPPRSKTKNRPLSRRPPFRQGLFPSEVPILFLNPQDDNKKQLRLLWQQASRK